MKMTRTLLATGLSALVLNMAATVIDIANAAPFLKPGQFKVGMEISYPPFESWQDGKVVGFDPEFSQMLAAKMGTTASFSDNKFASLILGLESNKFDAVISGMYIIPERVKHADAIPYAKTGAYIMVLKDGDAHPKTEKALCGMKVGLEQGTTWIKALNDLSSSYCVANGKAPISVHEFPSAPEVSQALMSRNVQAQLEIAGAATLFAERSKGRIEISSPNLVYPQTLGIYVKKGNSVLKQDIEKALAAIEKDGSYPALLQKYNLSPASN